MTTTPDETPAGAHEEPETDHDQDSEPPTPDGEEPDMASLQPGSEPGANPDPDPDDPRA